MFDFLNLTVSMPKHCRFHPLAHHTPVVSTKQQQKACVIISTENISGFCSAPHPMIYRVFLSLSALRRFFFALREGKLREITTTMVLETA